jgi:hypothetical protein
MLRNRLKPAIRKKKRYGLFSSGVCLQHDNAGPYKASRTVKQIHVLKLEVLLHPSYQIWRPVIFTSFGPWKTLYVDVTWGRTRGWRRRAWLAGTATKSLLQLTNLRCSGTLEEVCRTWWGLQCRLCHCTVSVVAVNHFIYVFRFSFEWQTKLAKYWLPRATYGTEVT